MSRCWSLPSSFVECGAIVESEVRAFGINSDVENAVAQTVAGAVSNRHGAIGVVNVLVTRGHLFEQKRAQSQREIAHLAIVRLEKFLQCCRRRIFHSARSANSQIQICKDRRMIRSGFNFLGNFREVRKKSSLCAAPDAAALDATVGHARKEFRR